MNEVRQDLSISVQLHQVMEVDDRTGYFVAHYKQFPQAIASGSTKEEASKNLIELFKLMLKNEQDEIVNELFKLFYSKQQNEELKLNLA